MEKLLIQQQDDNEDFTDNINIVKVSRHKVKPIKLEDSIEKKIRGADWFPVKYPNVALFSKKNQGKTTVILNIIPHMAGPETKIIIICPSYDNDILWKTSIAKLEEKYSVSCFHDIVDEEGANVITGFLDMMKEDSSSEDDEETKMVPVLTKYPFPVQGYARVRSNTKVNKNNKVAKVSKIIYPRYIIVMDDQGEAMRNKAVGQLLKTNRHWDTMTILSAQDIKDIRPSSIMQLDYIMLFPKIEEERLKKIYSDLKLGIRFDTFDKLYQDATSQPHQFLYIARSPEEFRKGFEYKYDVKI